MEYIGYKFVIGGLASLTAFPYLYRSIRSRVKARVNCWFCNKDSHVEYIMRNCFYCQHCEQYNGFDSDGDYNIKLPNSHIPENTKRFCARSNTESANVLCETCNRNQAIIMKKLAEFETENEDNWEDEYTQLKFKVEKMYGLCAQCSIRCHQKIEDDKRRFSDLLYLKDSLTRSVKSVFSSTGKSPGKKNNSNRSRRNFFSAGSVTECMHIVTFFITTLLFLAQLNFLQEDADMPLLPLPTILHLFLPSLLPLSNIIIIISFLSHLIACTYNKCRISLPDLILPFFMIIHLLTFFLPEEAYKQDLAVCRCALSSLSTILLTAVTFVPRKKQHKKRPNRVFSSAFSVASTPLSQCSSRNESFNGSIHDVQIKTPSTSISRHMREWREKREETPMPMLFSQKKTTTQSPEPMEWESLVSSTTADSPNIRRFIREETPARELAPSLCSLSLFSDEGKTSSPRVRQRRNAPFSSLSYNPSVNINRPLSQYTAPRSMVFTQSLLSVPRNDQPDKSHHSSSVFTSVSQQNSTHNRLFGWKGMILFAICSVLINIALFYKLFYKHD